MIQEVPDRFLTCLNWVCKVTQAKWRSSLGALNGLPGSALGCTMSGQAKVQLS